MIGFKIAFIAALLAALPGSADCVAQGNVKKVYVLFSNHLDIGYTKNVEGSTSAAVINQYFQQHFPKAIQTAEEARKKNKFRYSWMTTQYLNIYFIFLVSYILLYIPGLIVAVATFIGCVVITRTHWY